MSDFIVFGGDYQSPLSHISNDHMIWMEAHKAVIVGPYDLLEISVTREKYPDGMSKANNQAL